MSETALAAPAALKGVLPLYTTPELLEYYNKCIDQKYQPKGKNSERVDGIEVFYKPVIISQKFNRGGPFVEVLTEIFDSLGNLVCKSAYPFGVVFRVEKGYTRPGPNGEAAKFESLGTDPKAWPADEFCKTFERFDD